MTIVLVSVKEREVIGMGIVYVDINNFVTNILLYVCA